MRFYEILDVLEKVHFPTAGTWLQLKKEFATLLTIKNVGTIMIKNLTY